MRDKDFLFLNLLWIQSKANKSCWCAQTSLINPIADTDVSCVEMFDKSVDDCFV